MSKTSKAARARLLTAADHETLASLVKAHGGQSMHRVTGLMCAAFVAPGLVPPAAWVPFAMHEPADQETQAESLELLFRLYDKVGAAIDRGDVPTPEEGDEEGLAEFCGGFVRGARLDSSWRKDEARWREVEPICYYAGVRELVSDDTFGELSRSPQTLALARTRVEACIVAANTVRREALAATTAAARVGRNDPCPCGSGKKYKRCCMNTAVSD